MSGKRYSEIEIERGMLAAATLGIRPAARKLGIPHGTIRNWIEAQPERYAEIKTDGAPKWRAAAAASFEGIVDDLTELEADNLAKLSDKLDSVEAKDRGRLAKDLATAKGINSQHVHQLRGQPAQVVEHRVNLTLVQKAIASLEGGESVEGTATEVELLPLPPAA